MPRGVKAPLGQSAAQIVLRLQKASLQSRVRVEVVGADPNPYTQNPSPFSLPP